jgi:hypothetical protein
MLKESKMASDDKSAHTPSDALMRPEDRAQIERFKSMDPGEVEKEVEEAIVRARVGMADRMNSAKLAFILGEKNAKRLVDEAAEEKARSAGPALDVTRDEGRRA